MLLISNFIWGSQFVMVKVAQEQMGPVFATFFPMTIATLILIPIVHRESKKNSGTAGSGRMPIRDVRDFILIGVCGQVVAQLFVTWGVRLSLAENAALLMLCLPVSTAVMAYFFPWRANEPGALGQLCPGDCRRFGVLRNQLEFPEFHQRQVPAWKHSGLLQR
jgi:drug/metabolite transporter (DMT)-like permease